MTETISSTAEGAPDASRSTAERGSARWDLASHLRLWPVAAIGLTADLWTKHWAFTHLDPQEGLVIIRNLARLQRSLNTGALFGLGKGWTPVFIAASVLALAFVLYLFAHSGRDRRSLHIALALVLAGALGNLYDRAFEIADVVTYTDKMGTRTFVGKVTAEDGHGGLTIGSYPDGTRYPRRIPAAWNPQRRQQGVVRDFVKMEPRIHIAGQDIEIWPWVFNVADVLLVVGVGMLMLNFWWERRTEEESEHGGATASGAQPSETADPAPAKNECPAP